MGDFAQKIVKLQKDKLLKILNEAYAEEWLAYYQYWIGAKIAKGIARSDIVKEFLEHANEEFKHLGWLADRIIQLGSTPLIDVTQFQEYAKCKYLLPINEDTKSLVLQNLSAERCAILKYQEICDMCQGQDYITFNLSRKILKEEIEHEQEMEDFLIDFDYYNK